MRTTREQTTVVGVQVYELTPNRLWFVFVVVDATVFLKRLTSTYTVRTSPLRYL